MRREVDLLKIEENKEKKAVEEQKQKVKFSFQLEFFVAYHGQDSIAIG